MLVRRRYKKHEPNHTMCWPSYIPVCGRPSPGFRICALCTYACIGFALRIVNVAAFMHHRVRRSFMCYTHRVVMVNGRTDYVRYYRFSIHSLLFVFTNAFGAGIDRTKVRCLLHTLLKGQAWIGRVRVLFGCFKSGSQTLIPTRARVV